MPAGEPGQQLLRPPRRVLSPSLDQQVVDGLGDKMTARLRRKRTILQSFDAVFSEATYTAVTCFATDPEQFAQLRERVLLRLMRDDELHSQSLGALLLPRHSTLPLFRLRKVSTMFPDRSVNHVPGTHPHHT